MGPFAYTSYALGNRALFGEERYLGMALIDLLDTHDFMFDIETITDLADPYLSLKYRA